MKSISTTVENKEAWVAYAKSRGYKRISDFIWQAMVSYLRQRPPKEGSQAFEELKEYLE